MVSEPTVFVLDDDHAARESTCALVKSMGLSSRGFASAEEFLEAYDASQPGCLVADVRLPGMSGLQLQEKLVGEDIPLPVIVMTAFADVPLAVRAMKLGAVTLLEKPFRDEQLWEAIHKAIELNRQKRTAHERLAAIRNRLVELRSGERQVLEALIAGKPTKVIANELSIAIRTVEVRRRNIFQKMEVDSLVELLRLVAQVRE